MFGYVLTEPKLLSEQDNMRWHGWYCGLCKALGECCGQHSRLLLNYDMTFLAMLLSSVNRLDISETFSSCFMHPTKKHSELRTSASDYAADMNLLLAYYKLLDDWQDDRNPAALFSSALFKSKCRAIEQKYPRQHDAILNCLGELRELESLGEFNADLPANCFGRLMGELFVINNNDSNRNELSRFGRSLGRFIYIIDAATDLRADIKHERYNPLITYSSIEIDDTLRILGGELMQAYQRLSISEDKSIIENILTAGIWVKYNIEKSKVKANIK